jgi:hypothetical protein
MTDRVFISGDGTGNNETGLAAMASPADLFVG